MAVSVAETRDRRLIERFLRRDTAMHLYPLADLDEPLFQHTRWFVQPGTGEPQALALLFHGLDPPVLYAVCGPDDRATEALVTALEPRLPNRLLADVGVGIVSCFASWRGARRRLYRKMVLSDAAAPASVDTSGCVRLGPRDADELGRFYAEHAYAPDEEDGRYFDPYMLEIGPYFGARSPAGELLSAAGVHVCSRRYGVAALGNIATRPEARGRGHGRRVTAAVCAALGDDIEAIGLNVEVENAAAARCYERLGFREVCRYVEQGFERQPASIGP